MVGLRVSLLLSKVNQQNILDLLYFSSLILSFKTLNAVCSSELKSKICSANTLGSLHNKQSVCVFLPKLLSLSGHKMKVKKDCKPIYYFHIFGESCKDSHQ